MFTHGRMEILTPRGGEPAGDWPELLAYLQSFYGGDSFDWDEEVVYYRLEPHWMTVYAPDFTRLVDRR